MGRVPGLADVLGRSVYVEGKQCRLYKNKFCKDLEENQRDKQIQKLVQKQVMLELGAD